MAVSVNPPPQPKRPRAFQGDRDIKFYFDNIEKILLQLWKRTGGSGDLIGDTEDETTQLDELVLYSQLRPDNESIISTSADYTASDNEFIVVNSTGNTITLPANPSDRAKITVKNMGFYKTTIDPNGKTIDLETSVIMRDKLETIKMVYLTELDYWVIV